MLCQQTHVTKLVYVIENIFFLGLLEYEVPDIWNFCSMNVQSRILIWGNT